MNIEQDINRNPAITAKYVPIPESLVFRIAIPENTKYIIPKAPAVTPISTAIFILSLAIFSHLESE